MIKNSQDEEICVKLDTPKGKKGSKLAFICHGITGYKEQDVILQSIRSLTEIGYNVVSFDCRNSRGKSFNNHQCATLTDFCDDLETVILWAQKQDFYTTPFLLVGHSLGGATVLHFALSHPDLVSALILISSVFSGKDLLKNTAPEFLTSLQNGGIIRSYENVDCFLDDTYLKDAQKYDFYQDIQKFLHPVLLITGDKDTASQPQNNQDFFEKISSEKELHILKNCSHIYELPENQKNLDAAIKEFAEKI